MRCLIFIEDHCAECGGRKNLVWHHISYKPPKLLRLCRSCHAYTHLAMPYPFRKEFIKQEIKAEKEKWKAINIAKTAQRRTELTPTPMIICKQCGVGKHHSRFSVCYECYLENRIKWRINQDKKDAEVSDETYDSYESWSELNGPGIRDYLEWLAEQERDNRLLAYAESEEVQP